MTDSEPETELVCGTYAMAQQHKRRGEPIDDACREASSKYVQEWRQRPGRRDPGRVYNRAAGRAMQRLKDNHRAEYVQLLDEERQRLEPKKDA